MKRLTVILLAALAAAPALGELSSGPGGRPLHFLTPQGKIWSPVRLGVDGRYMLNPEGDLRGDGLPSFGRNPVTGMPEAVWARAEGDYEVAFSAFGGQGWSAPLLLTGNDANDLLPRIVFDEWGNRFVVWTSHGDTPGVFLTAAPVHAEWFWRPVRISEDGRPARRPSVVVVEGGDLWIAYEEDDGAGTSIVVAEVRPIREPGGFVVLGGEDEGNPFLLLRVYAGGASAQPVPLGGHGPAASGAGLPSRGALQATRPGAPSRGPVDTYPEIHQLDGAIWVDWLEGPGRLGWSAWDGVAFTEPRYLPVRSGREAASGRVRRLIAVP